MDGGEGEGEAHLEDVLLDPDHAEEGGDDDARPGEVQAVRVVERLRARAHNPLAQLHTHTRTPRLKQDSGASRRQQTHELCMRPGSSEDRRLSVTDDVSVCAPKLRSAVSRCV